jgi:hypothetical protein
MTSTVDHVSVLVRRVPVRFPRERVRTTDRTSPRPRPPDPAPHHFEERYVGTAAALTLAWLLVLGVVIGVAASATLLTLARHSGLDPAGPGQDAGPVSRAAWHLSK